MRITIDIDRSRWLRGSKRDRKRIMDMRERSGMILADTLLSTLREVAPIDTGALRMSFVKIKTKGGYVVTSLEPYAWYVEYGTGIYNSFGLGRKTPWVYKARDGNFYRTRGQKPQYYFRTALTLTRYKSTQLLKARLKGV